MEKALRKILKLQGETANFPEKFQGEIQVFPGENMELYRQNLKISGRNTGISGENEGFPGEIFHFFPPQKRQLIMEKNKKCFSFLYLHSIRWGYSVS